MPNHVRNIIRIETETDRIKEILAAIQDDGLGPGTIDFNKLVPMPASLDIEKGSRTDRSIKLYLTAINPAVPYFGAPEDKVSAEEFERIRGLFNKSKWNHFGTAMTADEVAKELDLMKKYKEPTDNLFGLAKQALGNIEQYGHMDWYDWSCEHWGTKWNAYDCHYDGQNELSFSTAWSAASPILQQLSAKFPDLTFVHLWADEDYGCNLGRSEYLGGELIDEYLPSQCSEEAYGMASDIWSSDPLEEYDEPEESEELEV